MTRVQIERLVLEAMPKVFSLWELEHEESACLFKVTAEEWSQVAAGTYEKRLTDEQYLRVKSLFSIHSSLRTIYNTETRYSWLKRPNTGPLMKGRRPIDFMLGDDWFPISQVRRHLEAEVAEYLKLSHLFGQLCGLTKM